MMKVKPRVLFDANNKEHVECFKNFLINSRWPSSCPFEVEYPWVSIPDMIKDELVRHYLKIKE
jgi:hypothetical protein